MIVIMDLTISIDNSVLAETMRSKRAVYPGFGDFSKITIKKKEDKSKD